MKIAIDWDTVVSTDPDLWAAFVKEAVFRGQEVNITTSAHAYADARPWAQHLDACPVIVPRFSQAQDVIGADIWVHGRPDRVLGVEQVHHVYASLNEF